MPSGSPIELSQRIQNAIQELKAIREELSNSETDGAGRHARTADRCKSTEVLRGSTK